MGDPRKLRLAGVAALAIAVAAAVPVAASASRYTGTFADGGKVSLKAVTRNGKIVRVKKFGWSNVPVTCAQGDLSYTAQLPFSMRVTSRAFSFLAPGTDLTQSVSGRFTNHRRRANGTLNVFGVLGLGKTGCSTGELTWTAVRR